MVLIYASGASGTGSLEVSIPSTIQNGKDYNNALSKVDFRGEGLKEGDQYSVRAVTKDVSCNTGMDEKIYPSGKSRVYG